MVFVSKIQVLQENGFYFVWKNRILYQKPRFMVEKAVFIKIHRDFTSKTLLSSENIFMMRTVSSNVKPPRFLN